MLHLPSPFHIRPITSADAALLLQIYASTREEELAQVQWDAAQKQAFLAMQFEAQHSHYQTHYTDTAFDLILRQDEPIGRLYLARWANEFRIVDITLLPGYRGQGIGSTMLRAIIAEADARELPVSIHVEQFNPAQRLYRRLGFAPVQEHGVYWLMRREPSLMTAEPHDHA